jgi:hypothetical protein
VTEVFAVNNFGDTRSGGLAGPMGLFLIVLMCIATVLLIRNMNKRIRRLPDSFSNSAEREGMAEIPQPDAPPGTPAPAAADGVEANRLAQATAGEEGDAGAVAPGDDDTAQGGGEARR